MVAAERTRVSERPARSGSARQAAISATRIHVVTSTAESSRVRSASPAHSPAPTRRAVTFARPTSGTGNSSAATEVTSSAWSIVSSPPVAYVRKVMLASSVSATRNANDSRPNTRRARRRVTATVATSNAMPTSWLNTGDDQPKRSGT